MTKYLSIFAVALSTAFAAVSPITSTNDFTFTRVTEPLISGVVMGDGGDYMTMRYEDLAFLHEAIAERMAFTGNTFDFSTNHQVNRIRWEFGRWESSDTNGTSASVQVYTAQGTTQTVAKAFSVTNYLPVGVNIDPAGRRVIRSGLIPTGLLDLKFASSTNEYITSPVLVTSRSSTTNIEEFATPVYSTTQRIDIITHSLTNGSVEVHTNMVFHILTNIVHRTVTNISDKTILDHCCASGTFGYERMDFVSLAGLFKSSNITNAFGMVRRADKPVMTMYPTNTLYDLQELKISYKDTYHSISTTESNPWDGYYQWNQRVDSHSETTSNGTFEVSVYGYASKARKLHRYHRYDDDSQPWTSLDEVVDESKFIEVGIPVVPPNFRFGAPFKRNIVTAGGRPPRITGGTFYLSAKISGSIERVENGATSVESRIDESDIVIPVSASIDMTGTPNSAAAFQITTDIPSAIVSAVASTGFKIPYSLDGMSSPEPSAIEDGQTSSSATRYYHLRVRPGSLIAILKLTPFTKLNGW